MSQNLPEEIFVVFLGSLGRWFLDCCHRLFPSKLKQPFMAAAHGQGHSFSSLDPFPVACGLKNEDQSPPVTPGGSFPIEAQAKYAVEVDAEFAAASSATPAPRPAISICRSPLVTPSLPSSSYCTGGFWPVHDGHNDELFLHPRRSAGGLSFGHATVPPFLTLQANQSAVGHQLVGRRRG